MKKLLLLLFALSLFSCEYKPNEYGVLESTLGYPKFELKDVTRTIETKLGCYTCIHSLKAPSGYPIGTPRVLKYEVIYMKNGELSIKIFYIGKVLKDYEKILDDHLILIEDEDD